jgi:hypothetical protein
MTPMERQNAEFDAVETLATEFARLMQTPVVDDDYPRVRHYYESAVRICIEAFKANGRK